MRNKVYTLPPPSFQAGPLVNVRIPVDRETKKQKPFAFVRFHHPESVPYAIELMRDVTLFGRSMRMQNKATGAGMGGRGGQYQQQRPPMPQFQPPQRQSSHESPRQEAAGLSSFQNNHQRSWSMPGTPVSVAQAAMMQQQQQQMMAQQMMMMGGGGGGGQGNPQMMAQQMMAMAQMQQMQQQQGHDGFGNFQQQQGFQQQQQQQDWRGGFDRDRGDGGGGRDNRGSSSTLYDRQRRDRDRVRILLVFCVNLFLCNKC